MVIVGDDLRDAIPKISASRLGVTAKFFPEINRSDILARLKRATNTSEVVFTKPFQFHKIHIFDAFFKRWKKILYIDSKMRVFNPIKPLLELDCEGALVAHSDAYPDYERTLMSQFNTRDFPKLSARINELVPMENDYFQTGMILYDSEIISEDTAQELIDLSFEFINSNSNEQAIINLWAQSQGLWTRLPTSPVGGKQLYDYWERAPLSAQDYILLKYPQATPTHVKWRFVTWGFSIYWRVFSRKLVNSQSSSVTQVNY